jgi:hypothetical protein
MACDDRQLTEAQRQAAIQQNARAGVIQAVRPFTGQPTGSNLADYINRELYPAVKNGRQKINDIYRQVTDNAPSGNPLSYYFSVETGAADPTVGRIRLNSATQDTATILRVSQTNARLKDVAVWLDVMNGGATTPLGTLTLTDAADPSRFLRFDLNTMTDQGAYWDLGVTPTESSHDNPFVDGESIAISFIPGVASTPATVPATSISGADGPRQFLSTSTSTVSDFRTLSGIFPGAPIYDVMAFPFNATGSLAGDDTAALNAAIAAANLVPGVIYLGPAHRITAALTPIANNNIRLIGRGEFNGGTILQVDSAAAVDAITISGCQYCSVERLWITGTRVFSSGFGIRFEGCFRCYTDRVVITTMCFGVEHVNNTLCEVRRTHLGDLYGVYGFLARGSGGFFNHAVRYECCVAGTDYPASVVGAATVWAPGTAYVVGNIVFANNNIYQCVQSGTSGASAPSGAGTTALNAHTVQIADGTVRWVFAMPLNVWFCQESGSQTFEVIDCGTLQGGWGLLVDNSAASVPLFTRVQNLQIDHPFTAGIQLNAGFAARMNQVFVTSVLEGSGIVISSGVSGGWEFIGGEVFGTAKAGMTIARGDGVISGVTFASIGLATVNTRDCIEVTNSAARFTIADCHMGTAAGASIGHRYGISVAAGSDNYVIVGNRCIGGLTGGILNTPGRASTRVVLNNIPDVTIAAGSVWGIQVDGATGVPFEITGLEVGELLRRETFVLETRTGTVTTLAVANITTQVVCKSVAALTFRGATATSATFGKTIEFSMHAGFAGTVTFKNEDASAASALERWACPDNADLTLSAGQVAVFTYFDSRWRCVGVTSNYPVPNARLADMVQNTIKGRAQGAVTGPPQDLTDVQAAFILAPALASTSITVAGAGQHLERAPLVGDVTATVNSNTTTIAADAVTNTKLANMAQATIKGRASGAGTGDPTDLTGAQVATIVAPSITGRLLAVTVYTSGSGTHTYDASTTHADIEVLAGGGGGGGVDGQAGVGNNAASSGGGAGAYARKYVAVTGGTGSSYTVGAGGAGGTGNVDGTNGGNSSTTETGSVDGGDGGLGVLANGAVKTRVGGLGGLVPAGGDINSGGAPGETGFNVSGMLIAGAGGSGPWGGGGPAPNSSGGVSNNGFDGTGPGSGGSGCYSDNNNTNQSGGAGKAGIVIYREYA